jgi:hypothetical protein
MSGPRITIRDERGAMEMQGLRIGRFAPAGLFAAACLALAACGGGGGGFTVGSSSGSGASSSSSSSSSSSGGSSSGASASSSSSGGSSGGATVNVLTYHNDVARTGQNLRETILTPASVNSAGFGKLAMLATQGLVDAEPLYVSGVNVGGAVHNVVYVVTEHDMAYAFDADSFAPLWQKSVLTGTETPSDQRSCGQVTPEIGITSTPVIDPGAGPHGTLYLAAMSRDSGGAYHQRLHALDLASGAELDGGPTEIHASYPKTGGSVSFDPGQYKERAALLQLGGTLYLSWTSHCDIGTYSAWVMAYSTSTLQQTGVINLTPNGSDGSVWMAGAGPAADASGNIYALIANGSFDTALNTAGFPSKGDYGNAFVKLAAADGALSVADYFTMSNTEAESNADQDLGSGGALVLPDLQDSGGVTRHLAVGAGKDASIYLVNRDSMGKFSAAGNSAIYQQVQGGGNGLGGGVFSMPAYFANTLYYGAVNDNLKAFPLAGARIGTPSSRSSASFGYPGATPSISANGSASGIVWAITNGDTAVLHAYDAGNLANELYNSGQAGSRDQFAGNKFITPMIANGKVYVGTPTGVAVFGLLH